MKNMVNQIDKLLKEEDKVPPHLKAQLQAKREILSKDKTVKK